MDTASVTVNKQKPTVQWANKEEVMTELVVLEKETALSVLTGDNGVGLLIDHVRDQVMSLGGGNLKTDSGRKKIKSNAFKATKAKTNANKVIDDLIQQNKDSIELKTKVEVATIEKLKQSKKELGAGLDKIRADVNAEVQQIEDDIKAEQDRIMAEEEAERRRIEVENCLELAHYMNADFDKQKEAETEAVRLAKAARDERLKAEAAEQAKKDAQAAIDAAELAKKQAEEREKQQAEQAKLDAELAEQKRLDDIEAAKQEQINKLNAEIEADRLAKEKAAADDAHVAQVNSNIKAVYIAAGFSEELAIKATKLLVNNQLPNTTFNY